MNVIAFVVAVVAALAFLVDVIRSNARSATAWGLLLLTVAWIVQSVHPVADVLVR